MLQSFYAIEDQKYHHPNPIYRSYLSILFIDPIYIYSSRVSVPTKSPGSRVPIFGYAFPVPKSQKNMTEEEENGNEKTFCFTLQKFRRNLYKIEKSIVFS